MCLFELLLLLCINALDIHVLVLMSTFWTCTKDTQLYSSIHVYAISKFHQLKLGQSSSKTISRSIYPCQKKKKKIFIF